MPASLYQRLPHPGWFVYLVVLAALVSLLPSTNLRGSGASLWISIGVIGVWRYSMGAIHFVRAMWFLHRRYPRLRAAAAALPDGGLPSRFYLLITSFRIEAATTAAVYRAAIREAVSCGVPVTIVASIVEMADEQLIKLLWQRLAPPARVQLRIVRIAGTGKRDALAHGFRSISRELPPPDALVAVIDGDTVLDPEVLTRTAPYFRLLPDVGALTTNEYCLEGSAPAGTGALSRYLMGEWHRLRFAQRHLNMCSMALSRRVLTLTGRMSVFRAEIVTDPEFIADVEADALDHWRLGRFRFLTGDDKSSWFSLMRLGWATWYVPDASITTIEHAPHRSFFVASRRLMFRWYGNSLRQNSRATRLGLHRLGAFTWYVLLDQRAAMWTSLFGLSAALLGALFYGGAVLVGYAIWIIVSRFVLALLLHASGHPISPAMPLLLYYNQIVGSLMKIDVSFHLDQQSWTRQHTRLDRGIGGAQLAFNRWSSRALLMSGASIYLAFVLALV